ncbi:DUF309 domain containing protein [Sulfitobacter noctilucicola]|uniref:DUF309 domain-containing protein n=1 Tax=Sulfitobacter noctilucicola TaxID=1342301 RepID=A0A7W6M7W0_9RHOB|nr:DUF309 domain-containing protein [Sulfitobacter noctilucicola]KIN62375.1 DUF309 domain containing protein [Sulfitobacter noctilucicola]MBB4173091.1 hypothetical protein [Sulfitobacter noctilucicola]
MIDPDSGGRLPPHVYIPGQTPRHPENWFDAIKDSVTPDTKVEDLHQTDAFKTGLLYLKGGYFWECHEVLEAVWMQTPPASVEREMVQSLIQLANARLKILMGRPDAARRLCVMVDEHLQRCMPPQPILGLATEEVRGWLNAVRRELGQAI